MVAEKENWEMADPVLWGIHAGSAGNADSLFLKKGLIAIGWDEVGDLSKIEGGRESFKKAVAKSRPDIKPGAIPVDAGQLFRFVHEMQVGDFVIYPSPQDRQVHIGSVEGPYLYDPSEQPFYPNRRPVKWQKSIPRTAFSQGALYEIGAAMSLFQIKNYADEVLAAIKGKPIPTPVAVDTTVRAVAEDIEETTRDFITKTLSQELKGHPLAHFVAHLLNAMGYRTRVSPEGVDGGVDILAHRDELGFDPPIIKVQVKSNDSPIGDPAVSALYGKVGDREYGLLVTLGTFTNQAKSFAKSKSNLRLVDGDELTNLIYAHYEDFDSRYKGILPLKKVYIPQPIKDRG
jgi:restriction system protein